MQNLLQAPAKESRVASAQKTQLPDECQGSIYNGKVRGSHRVCDQLLHNSEWWMVRGQGRVTGVNLINPQTPVDLEATCSALRCVNLFHLVGVLVSPALAGRFLTTGLPGKSLALTLENLGLHHMGLKSLYPHSRSLLLPGRER